ELPLQSVAVDTWFAVKSAWLEYRTAKDDPNRKRFYYDHRKAGNAIPRMISPLAPPLRLRWQSVQIDNRLSFATFRRTDGFWLREGDTLVIQMVADDFDDVAFTKLPGRSHELELRIVSAATLDALLNKDQASVRQDLMRLQQWQKEAREKADAANERNG